MKKAIIFLVVLLSSSVFADIKIATYNIRNFDVKHSKTNKAELKKILVNLKADIIAAQEIVNISSFKSFIKKEFPNYKVITSKCGGGGKQKLAFVYHSRKFKVSSYGEDNRFSDPGSVTGRFGCGRLRPAFVAFFKEVKTNREFVLIDVHLKAGGAESSYEVRSVQYDLVAKLVEELRLADHKNIMVMGDFNSTGYVDSDTDYSNFRDMLSTTGFNTTAKDLNCTSYWSGQDRRDGIEESSILDHIIFPKRFLGMKNISVELHSHCKKVKCRDTSYKMLGESYQSVSDHCPVAINIR